MFEKKKTDAINCENFKRMKHPEDQERVCRNCARQYLDGCPNGKLMPQGE